MVDAAHQTAAVHRLASRRRLLSLFLSLIGLGVTLVFLYTYFSADHRHPICCDTAITLVKAKAIARHGLRAVQPYDPAARLPLYGGLISTEFTLHGLLAVIFIVQPDLAYSLT